MIKEQDIKPIPKYILKLIKQKDKQSYQKYSGQTRFYSYFAKYNKELVQIIVALKNKNKNWYCKQVAIHGVHSEKCIVKDMEYFFMGGYVVGWYEQGLTKFPKWYESTNWCEADDKYFNPYSKIVNAEFALKFKQYKYSAVNQYYYEDKLKYLRLYEKFPQTEFLVKFGLSAYATSKTILKLVGKDKQFRNWLIQHSNEIKINGYYISTLLTAYKQNKDLDKAQQYETLLKTFCKNLNYKKIKKLFDNKIVQFFNYIIDQQTNESSYIDYLEACENLHLDMNLDKNKMPHNFKRWHDIRIDEYDTAKLKADEKKRKQFYKKFIKVAEKYLPMQRNLKDNYVCIIAKSPADLIIEGDKLDHCVGRMNYDQKFAREESLIFFIRTKETPNEPFVTVEYSLLNHKVLQCYGKQDSKPEEIVINYVNKVWLPYANRKLKKLVI
ncbi:MAG: PcfJ domain-containing protein [Clostridia bacterium]|nr:PcfJ domain-containing protein [Clostridia bacterium]